MRKRTVFLLGGLMIAAAAVALISSASASEFTLGLDSPQTEWPLDSDATLNVTVDPALVGGYGKLYRTIDGQTEYIKQFDFTSTEFSITGPIPSDPSYVGKQCQFKYIAFEAGGTPVGTSPRVKRPIAPLEFD